MSLRTREGLETMIGRRRHPRNGRRHPLPDHRRRLLPEQHGGRRNPGDLVEEALDPQPDDTLLDGYAGGGLFGISLGKSRERVFAIESNLTQSSTSPTTPPRPASITASSTTTSPRGCRWSGTHGTSRWWTRPATASAPPRRP